MTKWKDIQNRDGGWAYGPGRGHGQDCSWTEPTVFALLAQSVTQVDRDSFAGGLRFLNSLQRADGGWSPQPGVLESTWVTAMVALLPEEAVGKARLAGAVDWLKGQTGRESGWVYRIRQRWSGNKDAFPEGMPWFPGTAAWVIPTSLSILAFARALKRQNDAKLQERINAAQEFLFSHMCADGGWNHGSNRALGRDGESYPETTGVALLALPRAGYVAQLARAKAAAKRHFTTCRTAEGIAWLRMGLAAHGETVVPQTEPVMRTNLDRALYEIASSGQGL
jgi:hypothetical protein